MVPRLHPLGTLGGSLGTMRLRINYSPTASGEKLALAVDFIYKRGLSTPSNLASLKGLTSAGHCIVVETFDLRITIWLV